MRLLLLRELQARWLDSLLGALLIAVVIAALLAQRSLSASAGAKIHELAHHLGKNMLVLPAAMDRAAFYRGNYGTQTMPREYLARLHSSDLSSHIRESSALLYGNIKTNGVPLVLLGMDPWQGSDEAAYLGTAASTRLGLSGGASFALQPARRLTVAEVVESPPDGLDQGIFTSLATAQAILDKPDSMNALRLGGCWCRINVETLATEVEKLLPGTRAITIAGMIRAQKGTLAVMERFAAVLQLVGLGAIAGTIVTLLSAQVRRSRPEIGLLLAMGASPRMVSACFVFKAGLIGALGAHLGFLLGSVLTSQLGSRLLGLPLQVTYDAVLPVFGGSMFLSVLSALIPAWRASRLDPAEALRND
ncbi:MAG: FtsX-like permease family protein [Oligoflexia bacterium]|nr:FtsX-like permease family protein [Oligoflexia bacterium]